jgi:hypothetical protein
MKMKKYIYLIAIASIIVACGDADPIENEIEDTIDDVKTPERAEKAQLIFQTLPSPLETASLFQDAGSEYNPEITNPVENVSNYATNTQKALNLGVYGADLSYANIFDQSQESMFYMNCSKKMSDGLGITSAFDAETMERIEENMNNRDSLMLIINDAFWIADAHLKENGQNHLSALIITGGWIEGLHLGTASLNKEAPDDKLMQRIADQKYSLNNLVELLGSYDNAEVDAIVQKMQTLQLVYGKIEETEAEATVSDDGGMPTIRGGSTLTYDAQTIHEITDVIEKIRNEIIQ